MTERLINLRSGASIIELIVVIALFAVLGTVVAPIAIDTYHDHLLTSEVRDVLNILRRAKSLAISNNNESAYGVKVNSNQFVMFQGKTYETRVVEMDEVYIKEPAISILGLDEITFSSLSGFPSITTTIEFSNNAGRSRTIDINKYGTIFW